jgi:hypothetical protein
MRFATLVLFLAVAAPAPARADDEPPHRNPNPTFKPLGPDEEARQAPAIRGPFPALAQELLGRLRAGHVESRELPASTKDAMHFQAMGSVDAPASEVMAFLRDYPARVGVMPNNTGIEATWEGNLALVDMTLEVAFKTIRYRLAMLHFGDQAVVWEYVHGDLRDSRGSWKLFPYDNGVRTLVVYETETVPDTALPDFILSMLTKKSLPGVIDGVRKGVAKRRAKR